METPREGWIKRRILKSVLEKIPFYVFLLKSFYYANTYKELSTSQCQAIIKILEKKDRDKRSIKNWRSVLLLNTNLNISF